LHPTLNGKFFRNDTRLANERETYGTANEAFFLYFQKTPKWMIGIGSQFEQIRGRILAEQGLAHSDGEAPAKSKWQEHEGSNKWQVADNVRVTICKPKAREDRAG